MGNPQQNFVYLKTILLIILKNLITTGCRYHGRTKGTLISTGNYKTNYTQYNEVGNCKMSWLFTVNTKIRI